MNNGHPNEEIASGFADGELTLTVERDGEAWLQMVCARHAIEQGKLLDIIEEYEAHAAGARAELPWQLLDFQQRVKTGLSVVIGYTGDARMAARCFAKALDFPDIAGGETDEAIARAASTRRRRLNKQVVHKCLKLFQHLMRLPKLGRQRSAAACANMQAARLKQLEAT